MKHFYRVPGPPVAKIIINVQNICSDVQSITTEYCFNVEKDCLSDDDMRKIIWVISETYEPHNTREDDSFLHIDGYGAILEFGPRMAFRTAWSSSCASMLDACGVTSCGRIERSSRYLLSSSRILSKEEIKRITDVLHDRMVECLYDTSLSSFGEKITPSISVTLPVLKEGRKALERINTSLGLGFDEWDLDYYTNLFQNVLKRDPTDVECFDMGQSNSEHSRHWFFGGQMNIDGVDIPESLFDMVKATLPATVDGSMSSSIIAFKDNSSAIRGRSVPRLTPTNSIVASPLEPSISMLHPTLTAETHNFPTGVAPSPGAETGTGGRLRDVQATGRGAHTVAGICGYCVGNLSMPEYFLPWEPKASDVVGAVNMAASVDILLEASSGASDYGNKYGEPVVAGFARSFGQRLHDTSRVEWLKPIMFTAGMGLLDDRHAAKGRPEPGMVVCKVGGPAYRIGMGGGAASSRVDDTETAELDFSAVQRGDAEMENRLNRVIRACVELGDANPIVSIHDQGAGGNGNVLKELVDPVGAEYVLDRLPCGDPTMSSMELWGAEYQENNAFLVRQEDLETVQRVGRREHCSVAAVGTVTGTGRVVAKQHEDDTGTVVDLPLSLVLGEMPRKRFESTSAPVTLTPLVLPPTSNGQSISSALDRVFRLVDVGSKRFLTNKVDRSVSGLVAQQQCVGPYMTPVANCAVVAASHFTRTGTAFAVGEQPIKGLLDPVAQAALTVGEAFLNLMFAQVTSIEDVRGSANWMWAAKLQHEGARMTACCASLCESMRVVGAGIDGGKDSLSMSVRTMPPAAEIVKAPGQITLSLYASCPDVTCTITPDLKAAGTSRLLYFDLGHGRYSLGGSALAITYSQVGQHAPACGPEDMISVRRAFEFVQKLGSQHRILAGHDRSDGGLITTLIEMSIAGNIGMSVNIPFDPDVIRHEDSASVNDDTHVLFGEELGFVLEVPADDASRVVSEASDANLSCVDIGTTLGHAHRDVLISINGGSNILLTPRGNSVTELRSLWEKTSFALERRQASVACVDEEERSLAQRTHEPAFQFDMSLLNAALITGPPELPLKNARARVAILRNEGTNGDREMAAAFFSAGLEPWDVCMSDLMQRAITLDRFRGIVLCGGFSYADVNGSAKGWAATIHFNAHLLSMFSHFRKRLDTFSLGVCNGCQLLALLGWVPSESVPGAGTLSTHGGEHQLLLDTQPRFVRNVSERFESRWVSVSIQPSPAILLRGMEGSKLGVWTAHSEGCLHCPLPSQIEAIEAQLLAPIRYIDDEGDITEAYPFNPNGSARGIASLCSPDGRHLAIMPHPERCFLSWQLPYVPDDWKERMVNGGAAPWMALFYNAKVFCDEIIS